MTDLSQTFGSDACRVDEDEIRQVRLIDLLDLAIDNSNALDCGRTQKS
jgi:hypothetical protein